ncbi:outer membrane receptor for ferrienterochelin and colicin [Burkholderiales bacterium JOSHI_001]|nr:outer membrane receptor for ferrienterochelin and colicin [Burkholderiales bacterium JOSHI_001]
MKTMLTCLAVLAGTAPIGAAHAQAAAAPAAAASEPQGGQRVEVSGQRGNDTEQRRQSTAAKIVIGREEIERYGDATVGEILRRLPGVTSSGPAGRGGPPRMRGLGSGYTQILLDGERVPPGFSVETLSPEQIERIEVLRAPSAETGARAMAGTINIITREGFAKKFNDLRLTTEFDNGRVRPSASWTVNGRPAERWNANLSATLSRQDRAYQTRALRLESLPDGSSQALERELVDQLDKRDSLNVSTRWQWLGEEGQALTLSPFMVMSEGSNQRNGQLQSLGAPTPGSGIDTGDYQRFDYLGHGRFALLRLNGQYRHRLEEGTRLEWRGGVGGWRSSGNSLRQEFNGAGAVVHSLEEQAHAREHSGTLALKGSHLLESDHSLVGGVELESVTRQDSRSTLRDGVKQVGDFGDDLQATSQRQAAFLQDEWQATPQWAGHAGLRWEAITTRGSLPDGGSQRNRSEVWTPLLHAVWKPEPRSRDQVRLSLTRSYRAPTLSNLLGRPNQSANNSQTRPDRAGNPELRPELATGVDIAFEHYLSGGGLFSANLFRRNIKDLIRAITQLETDSTSGASRWVSRPQNVGNASTQGLELEAKFRLPELLAEAPPLDVRSNLSVYSSRVKTVPGPDNRLDQQPHATLNLGLDYRLRGLPLTVGGNLNLTPGYDTRLAQDQTTLTGRKRVFDAYALWTFNPTLGLRLSASNLSPQDYLSGSTTGNETTLNEAASSTTWQLRLEMKL